MCVSASKGNAENQSIPTVGRFLAGERQRDQIHHSGDRIGQTAARDTESGCYGQQGHFHLRDVERIELVSCPRIVKGFLAYIPSTPPPSNDNTKE